MNRLSRVVRRRPGARLLDGIYEATAYAVVSARGRLRSVHWARSLAVAAKQVAEDKVREEPVLTDGEWFVTVRALKVDTRGEGFAVEQRLASGRVRRIEAQRFGGETDSDLDAPDDAVVEGYERQGDQRVRSNDTRHPCTCLGACRGAKGLGENWYCVLEAE